LPDVAREFRTLCVYPRIAISYHDPLLIFSKSGWDLAESVVEVGDAKARSVA
jgi:hypothetical protein